MSDFHYSRTYSTSRADTLASACGKDPNQVSISGGHSAFASVPEELADVLVQIVEK